MKKYLLAVAIASGTLFGLSAQAAPLSPDTASVQHAVTSGVEKVWHCRHWSGGWGCGGGWHSRYRSHWRWGSRRRWWR